MPKTRRIAPWRRTFQGATTLALLLIPFLRLGGESVLRVDLPTRTLLAFGRSFWLEELYLFLLLVIGAVLGLLLLTLVLGRVWCGWACPQTTLSDLVETFSGAIGVRPGCRKAMPRPWQVLLFHGFCAGLAALVACNLVWYFVSPYEFFPRLADGDLPGAAVFALAVVGTVGYLDLAFVRRTFCRTVCPYGRIQAALVDPGTLTLRVQPGEAGRCIQCEACVRACPTGIDIREGDQIECISCGRCLDACRGVMAKKGEPGIVGYSFGVEGRGPRALLNPRTGIILVAGVIVGAALVIGGAQRSPLGFSVRRTSAATRLLPGGGRAFFFTGYVSNRGQAPLTLDLTARLRDGHPLDVRGQTRSISLAAGARKRVDFALVVPSDTGEEPRAVVFQLSREDLEPIATAQAIVGPSAPGEPDG